MKRNGAYKLTEWSLMIEQCYCKHFSDDPVFMLYYSNKSFSNKVEQTKTHGRTTTNEKI